MQASNRCRFHTAIIVNYRFQEIRMGVISSLGRKTTANSTTIYCISRKLEPTSHSIISTIQLAENEIEYLNRTWCIHWLDFNYRISVSGLLWNQIEKENKRIKGRVKLSNQTVYIKFMMNCDDMIERNRSIMTLQLTWHDQKIDVLNGNMKLDLINRKSTLDNLTSVRYFTIIFWPSYNV